MKEDIKRELKSVWVAALVLFLSISFVVTVTFLIFFRSIRLDDEQIRTTAPATFGVVVAVTAAFVIGYMVIRYITVVRPLRRINATLERIAHGDFSERLGEDELYANFTPIVQNINRMTDELASSALLKTDFVSNVSHELKTPLAAIQNYATLLEADTLPDAERREYAKAVAAASRRMSELITNILRLNRLENQRLEAKKEQFDLSAQLGECVLGFEPIWEEKGIALDIDIADGVAVSSDAELLALVWNNLLSNAFKFTEPGGTVGVTLKAADDEATVTVSDTGCGMDAATGRHIFDKFYQGDTSHATQGNGLGLALVKRVIDLVGGEISVQSTVGVGSTFSVTVKADTI